MITCDVVSSKEDIIDYSEFINKFSFASFNASLKFLYFLTQLLDKSCIPYYFIARNEDRQVVGVLPAFMKKGIYGAVLNSLPWFGSNPGVIADSPEVSEQLVDAFFKTAKWTNCVSATIISNPFHENQWDYKDLFCEKEEGRYLEDYRIGTMTTLPDCKSIEDKDLLEHQLIGMYHQKTRNQLRKSIELCRAEVSYRPEAFEFLMKTHKENMEAVGAPYKTKEFDIIKTLKENEDYKLFISYDKKTDDPAAALLLKYYNKTVDYMIPATSLEYRSIDPLHILIHLAMMDAAQRGYKYWNWGGSLVVGMDGVKHFKSRFGGKTFPYTYHTLLFRPLEPWVTKEAILEQYKYFYVLPFKEMEEHANT